MSEVMESLSDETLELLERRAERLRQDVAAAAREDSEQWVAEFSIGKEHYAIPLRSLRASLPLRAVSPVPLADASVIGILRFQGEMLTVFSLASLLGVRGWHQDPAVLLVVELGGGRLVAVDCEETPRPVAIPLARIEQSRSAHGEESAILEVATDAARHLNLVNLGAVLRNHRERRGQPARKE